MRLTSYIILTITIHQH